MASLAGYNIGEEAKEVKENLFKSRDNFVLLVVAGVIGGIVTRFIVPKSVTEGSIFNRIKSWLGYDQDEEEED